MLPSGGGCAPRTRGSSASNSAAVMSLIEGRELAAMMTVVPCRSSSLAKGSIPASQVAQAAGEPAPRLPPPPVHNHLAAQGKC
jgi:hypothetical protein